MSTNLNCPVWGIDASEEAINQAHHHYSTVKTFYTTKFFPFILPENTFDFVTSIESIEHVENSRLLVKNLVSSLKVGGYLFASVPNNSILPLEKNPNKFHYKHFLYAEFIRLVQEFGKMRLDTYYSQNAYKMKNRVVQGYLKDHEMKLKHMHKHGQFLYFVFQKIN
jgi:SAM-dependent methyltransferase